MGIQGEWIFRWLGGAAVGLSGLLVSILISWYSLSALNFLYPVIYDVLDIEETIDEYAPRNRYRRDFRLTTREHRSDLFRQIVFAVNHGGDGLQDIRYFDGQGRPIGLLLRKPEIVHLRDVAQLIDTLRLTAIISMAVFVILVAMYWRAGRTIPSVRSIVTGVLVLLLSATGTVALYGGKSLFYQLHVLIFPKEHQWFFYYEESLMSMLMKAPDIFAYLAVMLAVLSLLVLALLLLSVRTVLAQHQTQLARRSFKQAPRSR